MNKFLKSILVLSALSILFGCKTETPLVEETVTEIEEQVVEEIVEEKVEEPAETVEEPEEETEKVISKAIKNIQKTDKSSGIKTNTRTEVIYDENGETKEEYVYNKNDELEELWKFNQIGNVLTIEANYTYGDHNDTYLYERTFDDNGNMILEYNTDTYSWGGEEEYSYSKHIWEYDENGNLIFDSYRYGDSEDDLTAGIDCDYENELDDKGRVIKEVCKRKAVGDSLFEDGVDVTEHAYDDFDREILYKSTDSDGSVYISESEYDEKGNKTKRTVTRDGEVSVTTWQYEYDENGNFIKVIEDDSDYTKETTYTYEYFE